MCCSGHTGAQGQLGYKNSPEQQFGGVSVHLAEDIIAGVFARAASRQQPIILVKRFNSPRGRYPMQNNPIKIIKVPPVNVCSSIFSQ